MISSNFVGCSTGKSAGLAPFRILSTYGGDAPVPLPQTDAIGHRPPASAYMRQGYMAGATLRQGHNVVAVRLEHQGVRQEEEGASPRLLHGGEGPLDVLRTADLQHLQCHP